MAGKFECIRCGNCCKNLEKPLPETNSGPVYFLHRGLLIDLGEKEGLEREAKKLGLKLEIGWAQIAIERVTGEAIGLAYSLKHSTCPFLGEDNKCRVWKNRPHICRAFPANAYVNLWDAATKVRGKQKLGMNTGCPADKFFREYKGKLEKKITGKEYKECLKEYFGGEYAGNAWLQARNIFIAQLLQRLDRNCLFQPASGKPFKEISKELDLKKVKSITDYAVEKGLTTSDALEKAWKETEEKL